MNKNLYLHLEPHDISPESGATIEVIINSEGIVVDAWSLDECIATTHKTYDEDDNIIETFLIENRTEKEAEKEAMYSIEVRTSDDWTMKEIEDE